MLPLSPGTSEAGCYEHLCRLPSGKTPTNRVLLLTSRRILSGFGPGDLPPGFILVLKLDFNQIPQSFVSSEAYDFDTLSLQRQI
jgi:hypothetical protein